MAPRKAYDGVALEIHHDVNTRAGMPNAMMYDLDLGPAPPLPRSLSRLPHFRLRYRPIFWRVFFITLLVLEFTFWFKFVRPFMPFRPRGHRLLVVAFMTPKFMMYAFCLGALVTAGTDLVFRLSVRPLMRRWYWPKSLDPMASHPLEFQLGVGERVLDERPARRVAGRRNQPGTLARTNRRLYFFPYAWDIEPWSLPFEHLDSIRLTTPRRRVLGWVEGYPDHVVIKEDSGEATHLIVADPREVLAWFETAPDTDDEALDMAPSEAFRL